MPSNVPLARQASQIQVVEIDCNRNLDELPVDIDLQHANGITHHDDSIDDDNTSDMMQQIMVSLNLNTSLEMAVTSTPLPDTDGSVWSSI